MTPPRTKNSFRLPGDLIRKLDGAARARNVSRTAIVEAALASFLSPDGAERMEAALSRRLDRLTRQMDRLGWHVDLTNETLALFIRFWLVSNAPLPDTAMKAAQAAGKERWERFVASLGKKMSSGARLKNEISFDINSKTDIERL